MKIDFHVHAFPDKVAEKAIPKLSQTGNLTPTTDGTVRGAKELAIANGFDKIVLLNVAETPAQQTKANDFALSQADDVIIPFAALHPLSLDWKDELNKATERGAKGVKLHPEYQLFDVDDSTVYPFYEEVAKRGMILLFHAGFDPAFPQSRRCYPDRAKKMADDFAGAKIVFAHMGNCLDLTETATHLLGKPVYFDISMAHTGIPPKVAGEFIKAHGVNKFLFGTDTPWGGYEKTLNWLNETGLSADEIDRILGENAQKLLEL